jgi:hypothetical protein
MTTERKSIEPATSGRSRSARARATKLSPEERSRIAKEAAFQRWHGNDRALVRPDDSVAEEGVVLANGETEALDRYDLPEAAFKGVLRLMDLEIPCYVLSTGQRVIGRTAATEMLTGIKGGGDLEKYIGVASLRQFVNVNDVIERMVPFRLPEVEGLNRSVKGLPADALIELCQGLVKALEASTRIENVKLTARQLDMAFQASMFLSACAKVGLDALIDEATGYQYEREHDALQVKLNAYLADEMRKWEKTFPDELWIEFGRLTGWHGSVTQRPKYWGKLVMELIYDYLDKDVADWLRENAPRPQKGQNYHQWLSGQYGLRKLTEHIWKVVGIAKTCNSMIELKDKMAELHGRRAIQLRLYVDYPVSSIEQQQPSWQSLFSEKK